MENDISITGFLLYLRLFLHQILASPPGILASSPGFLAPSPGW